MKALVRFVIGMALASLAFALAVVTWAIVITVAVAMSQVCS